MKPNVRVTLSALAFGFALAACGQKPTVDPERIDHEARAIEARAFLRDAENQIASMSHRASEAYWAQATNITPETNSAAAEAGAEYTKLMVSLANASKQFDPETLPADVARKIHILRSSITLPAPSREGAADELAAITTRLDTAYSTGKFLYQDSEIDLIEASGILQTSRDPAELQAVWEGWHSVAAPMAEDYTRMVEIANEGARELGYPSLDQMWLSNYDMPPEEMEKEVARLWDQVKPLYTDLHCYARGRLNEFYGDAVQPSTGPIRADLLGNMWAQSWSGVYDILKTDTPSPSYDLTTRLSERGYTPVKMVETAEAFFTSLGLDPLPASFWERSMITRPEGREVVCHASAWNLDDLEDVRIKMCTQVNAEDFYTVHHELGHNYYQLAYRHHDHLYKNGAHDGFHEAIGDFIALSITPEYLEQIGLISASEKPGPEADIALLLQTALDKVAFLPFGLSVDSWRWGVLSGETPPEAYNQSWTELRLEHQGIIPPAPRPADAFDPGAKYHIPGNTPYLRYFLSFIMQFQFHKAACEQAGWDGPLHRCSIYGNREVGRRFNEMMEAGMSEPWPDTLEKFTGTREMDGSAIIEYFEPLTAYLKEQNKDQLCGW